MAYTEQNRGAGVCEVWATGAKGNGGYFDATIAGAGTDYTQQAAAQLSLTDLATTGAVTTLTSVTGGFTAAMIGNAINITSGTNFDVGADNTSVYYITAVASSNSCTLDRTPTSGGAGSGGVGKVGGARASIGGALANQASGGGTKVFVKGGSYTSTSSTTNIDGGKCVTVAGSNTYGLTRVIGYSSIRGDGATGTRPAVAFAFGASFIDTSAGGSCVSNIDVDCNNTASSVGFTGGPNSTIYGCKSYRCASSGFLGSNTHFVACLADTCSYGFGNGGASVTYLDRCWAKGCTNDGFEGGTQTYLVECLSTGNGGHGYATTTGMTAVRCLAVGNTLSGFYRSSNALGRGPVLIDCLSAYNTTYGYEDLFATYGIMQLRNCASVGNGTARSAGVNAALDMGAIALSGDPFMSRANNDFRLSATNAGRTCAQGGFNNLFSGYSSSPQNSFVGPIPTLRKPTVENWPNAQGWPDGL